ncbi:hypothetical protein VULLAG_LOCUS11139 [Vulpes lagopus]
MQGARHGTRSQVSRITPWAEGDAKPLSHRSCLNIVLILILSCGWLQNGCVRVPAFRKCTCKYLEVMGNRVYSIFSNGLEKDQGKWVCTRTNTHTHTHTHLILVICGFHVCELAYLPNLLVTPKSVSAVLQQLLANLCGVAKYWSCQRNILPAEVGQDDDTCLLLCFSSDMVT